MLIRKLQSLVGQVARGYYHWSLEDRMMDTTKPIRDRLQAAIIHLSDIPTMPGASATEIKVHAPTLNNLVRAWNAVADGMYSGDYPHMSHFTMPDPHPVTVESWAIEGLIQESIRGKDRGTTWMQSWRFVHAALVRIEDSIRRKEDLGRIYRGTLNTLLADLGLVLRAARKDWEV